MRQTLICLLALSSAYFGMGKRIELLRFNQARTVATGDFIPVYSAVEEFPTPYRGFSGAQPNQKAALKRVELRNFDASSSLSTESELRDYEPLESSTNSEGRNFQPLQVGVDTAQLGNYQALPALGASELGNYQTLPTPELTSFQLPAIATSALKNLRPATNEAASSGRTFKHFLLLKSLLGSGGNSGGYGSGGYGGGGYGGQIIPLIINTPVNVTNWNNNTLTNTPAAAAAAAGAALEDAVRINYIGVPQTQAQTFPIQLPLQMPTQVYNQPTPVYQQRQALTGAQPAYAMAMLNIPGTSSFMPFPIPQYQSPVNRNSAEVQRRPALAWPNASKNQNPWSAFTNNLRGLQFL